MVLAAEARAKNSASVATAATHTISSAEAISAQQLTRAEGRRFTPGQNRCKTSAPRLAIRARARHLPNRQLRDRANKIGQQGGQQGGQEQENKIHINDQQSRISA